MAGMSPDAAAAPATEQALAEAELPPSDLTGTRAQAVQRVQMGIAGLVAMMLLVALASTVMEQAREAEDPELAVGEASPAPEAATNDPLVDIGVVPELPAETVVPDLPAESMLPAATGTPSPAPAPANENR